MLTLNNRMAEKVSAITVLNLQRIFPAYFHFFNLLLPNISWKKIIPFYTILCG